MDLSDAVSQSICMDQAKTNNTTRVAKPALPPITGALAARPVGAHASCREGGEAGGEEDIVPRYHQWCELWVAGVA